MTSPITNGITNDITNYVTDTTFCSVLTWFIMAESVQSNLRRVQDGGQFELSLEKHYLHKFSFCLPHKICKVIKVWKDKIVSKQ